MFAPFRRTLTWYGGKNHTLIKHLFDQPLPARSISSQTIFTRTQDRQAFIKPRASYLEATCNYAKGVKKEKGKKAKGGKSEDIFKTISEDQINEMVAYSEMCKKMDDVVSRFQQLLMEKITLRTNASAYDNVVVKTDSGKFKLMELAQITQKSPTMIAISMDAAPQYIKDAKAALFESGLNVNPQQDGTSLFIQTPKVTKEHRETLVKNARALATKCKGDLGKIQQKYTKDLNAQGSIGKTEKQQASTLLMNTFKKYSANLDSLVESKSQELLNS